MADKEYIERDSIYRRVKERTNPYGKPTLDYESGVKVLDMIKQEPAADVVSLDDVREAFHVYICEMTCSKYGTPEETQFARDIVKQAVDMVLGERKEQT